jgi:gluconate 2-dehydrogenase gamma chain
MTDNTEFEPPSMDRRDFLALLALAASAYPVDLLAQQRQQEKNGGQPLEEPWNTIAAVQNHLFPAEKDSPGAEDIRALLYLQNMLQAPNMDEKEATFIKQGVTWLNDISRKQKSRDFAQLDESDREQVLRTIDRSRAGERWLSLVLSYVLEALLSDPVYGGNPDGIGWQWLEHQPGYPTPSTEKIYYKLGSRHRLRRTRA